MYIKNSFEIRYVIKSILLIEALIFAKIIIYFKYMFLHLKLDIEFQKIEYYKKFCNKNKQNMKIFYKNKYPNISIISPIFNREKYIYIYKKYSKKTSHEVDTHQPIEENTEEDDQDDDL